MSQTTAPSQSAKVQQAVTAHTQGRIDEAARLYREILDVNPAHFDALHLLGVIHMQKGDPEQAAVLIGKAVQIDRKKSEAHNNLSMALRELGRLEEALAPCNKAIALKVDNGEAHYNRALVLLDLQRYEQALAGFRKAIALIPDHGRAYMNMGVTLLAMDRFEEGYQSFTKSIALEPGNPDAHHNLGHALQCLHRMAESRLAFQRAIALAPQHAEAHAGLSECLLQAGEYGAGWQEYEWRWKAPHFAPFKRDFAEPIWLGREDIAGKTILVHAEQGLGDTLQFVRYLKGVKERGATVVLEVQPPLKKLLSTVAGASRVLARGEPLPRFDVHCPLLSLPLALNIEGNLASAPYIQADQAVVEKWRGHLGPSSRLRCGIIWSGKVADRGSARYRSAPLSAFTPLAHCGVDLVSLQYDIRDSDRATLESFEGLQNLGPDLPDFSDVAGVMANCDLIITIDTSMAHLAGAMGKPVWILLSNIPDWRWQISGGNKTPWYASAQLFRQPKLHDWDSVIAEVVTALKGFQRA